MTIGLDLQARLARRRRGDRRRSADRPQRRARVPGGRGVHDEPARAARAPRSAVGQLADGRIVLVAVDGRQPGYSVGMTNFELAQALVRLGAVTGMALDSGGSTTMAFDGTLLNRPSDGQRAADLDRADVPVHRRLRARSRRPLVSPNGDGVDDGPGLRYRVCRPSTVTAALNGPGAATTTVPPRREAAGLLPGTVPRPGRRLDRRRRRARGRRAGRSR